MGLQNLPENSFGYNLGTGFQFGGDAEAVEALVCKTSLSGFESRRYLQLFPVSLAVPPLGRCPASPDAPNSRIRWFQFEGGLARKNCCGVVLCYFSGAAFFLFFPIAGGDPMSCCVPTTA
jgi:hypothetical protein